MIAIIFLWETNIIAIFIKILCQKILPIVFTTSSAIESLPLSGIAHFSAKTVTLLKGVSTIRITIRTIQMNESYGPYHMTHTNDINVENDFILDEQTVYAWR